MIHGIRGTDGRLYVDNSILSAEAACQTRASIRYMLALEAVLDAPALECGRAMHKAFEEHFRGAVPAQVLAVLEREYKAYAVQHVVEGGCPDYHLRFGWENVRRVLAAWVAARPVHTFPFTVDVGSIEQGFCVPLVPEDDIWYTGTPDIGKVTFQVDGKVYFVDHKTTGRLSADWRVGFRTSGQISGYCWGLTQATGVTYAGGFINALELAKLPGSTRRCKDHGVPYVECAELHVAYDLIPVGRSAEQLERWKANAVYLAQRYAARVERVKGLEDLASVAQDGMFSHSCGFCAAREFCETGQNPVVASQVFVEQAWDPQAR